MTPNIENAAVKAVETVEQYKLSPNHPDPLIVLNQLNNVYLISHDAPEIDGLYDNQDALTLVNKTDNGLQYIVIYNRTIDQHKLRFALARELAHIILEHDGSSPEDVWSAEAACFAYHFLCPLPLMAKKTIINYRPIRINLSWELKEMVAFDSISEMKAQIADERNRYNRFIGKNLRYKPEDVELINHFEFDKRTGWKNCCEVVIDGKKVGYCGE